MKIGERRETQRWVREMKEQIRKDELRRRRILRMLLRRVAA